MLTRKMILLVFFLMFVPTLAYAASCYFQAGYYSQGSYYSQGAYYSESGYYSQGEYYSEAGYYSQGEYYAQASYWSGGTYTFEYEPNGYCAVVTVSKRTTPPYTTIRADGYSVPCAERATNPRTLQRSVELSY